MASEIEKSVQSYRRQVEAEEKEIMRRMARLWVPSRKLLMEKIRDLTAAIEAQQAKGESVWIGYVHSLAKYQELLRQTEAEIAKYAEKAKGEIAGKAGDAAGLGAEEAADFLKIADPSSPTSPVWTQVNRSAAVSAAGVTQSGTPLDSLLEKSFGEAKKGIESALITGIGTGQGWSWVADQMIKAADVPYERAVRIARTEINRSLREASYQSYKASGVVLGYRRMCFKPTACLACLMLDGEFTSIDAGPLSDHPNGKCTQVAVTRHYDPIDHGWQTGREWLEQQSEEDQRRIMGAGRFELWKSGGVDPKSMVYLKDNPIWGSQPGIIGMAELQKFTNANHSRISFPGKNEDGSYNHKTTTEIQNAESFAEISKLFKRKDQIDGPVPYLDDSISNYPLEVQKEIAEGIEWATREFNIRNKPLSIKRTKMGGSTLGKYYVSGKRIELRHNLSLQDAFSTTVHELVHHSQNIGDYDCDKIIKEAARIAGYDRRTNEFADAVFEITNSKMENPEEIIAYSISACSVGKGNTLAQSIYGTYKTKRSSFKK